MSKLFDKNVVPVTSFSAIILSHTHAPGDLDLPVQLRIFESLGAEDLLRTAATCREWRDVASQDVLWRRVLTSCPTLLVPPEELNATCRSGSAKSQFFVAEVALSLTPGSGWLQVGPWGLRCQLVF